MGVELEHEAAIPAELSPHVVELLDPHWVSGSFHLDSRVLSSEIPIFLGHIDQVALLDQSADVAHDLSIGLVYTQRELLALTAHLVSYGVRVINATVV
jgi:hypothetical protein